MEADEQRLRTYLTLIEQLLHCPSGEETQILQAHEDLIDAGFIATTQQVAQMMEQRGDQGAVSFLTELARQLQEQLESPSQQRFDLLIRLLEITEETQRNPAPIVAQLQADPELIDQELLEIFQSWGDQILRQMEPGQAKVLGVLLGNFANVLVSDLPLTDQTFLREMAIVGYRFVLRIFTEDQEPQRWGQTHTNLGQAFRKRLLGDRKENLDLAIEHLQYALSVRTPTDQPETYERTQAKLEEIRQERKALVT